MTWILRHLDADGPGALGKALARQATSHHDLLRELPRFVTKRALMGQLYG